MITLTSPRRASKYFRSKNEFTTGPVELDSMIKHNENMTIIDVRMPEDFLQGHIPGAINLCRKTTSSYSGLSKDKANIVYCYSEDCHQACEAAEEFAEHGYPVMELQGGFEGWKQHQFPIEA